MIDSADRNVVSAKEIPQFCCSYWKYKPERNGPQVFKKEPERDSPQNDKSLKEMALSWMRRLREMALRWMRRALKRWPSGVWRGWWRWPSGEWEVAEGDGHQVFGKRLREMVLRCLGRGWGRWHSAFSAEPERDSPQVFEKKQSVRGGRTTSTTFYPALLIHLHRTSLSLKTLSYFWSWFIYLQLTWIKCVFSDWNYSQEKN